MIVNAQQLWPVLMTSLGIISFGAWSCRLQNMLVDLPPNPQPQIIHLSQQMFKTAQLSTGQAAALGSWLGFCLVCSFTNRSFLALLRNLLLKFGMVACEILMLPFDIHLPRGGLIETWRPQVWHHLDFLLPPWTNTLQLQTALWAFKICLLLGRSQSLDLHTICNSLADCWLWTLGLHGFLPRSGAGLGCNRWPELIIAWSLAKDSSFQGQLFWLLSCSCRAQNSKFKSSLILLLKKKQTKIKPKTKLHVTRYALCSTCSFHPQKNQPWVICP